MKGELKVANGGRDMGLCEQKNLMKGELKVRVHSELYALSVPNLMKGELKDGARPRVHGVQEVLEENLMKGELKVG